MPQGNKNPFLDPSLWQDLQVCDDDIVITTYAKFGHLRMQIIINELINIASGVQNNHLPWVELRHPKSLDRIKKISGDPNRHILRSHLSANEIFRQTGKYIFVGRDPRDLIFNLYYFLKGASPDWQEHFSQYGFKTDNPIEGFEIFWEVWMNKNGFPIWPYFSYLQSWWKKRNEANVLFIHFLDFKSNMEKELRRIADFLELDLTSENWSQIASVCSYENISNLCLNEPQIDSSFWNGGHGINHVTSIAHTWRDHLNKRHDIELQSKLREAIGQSGKDWVLEANTFH